MKKITVRILKNGKLYVETCGMRGKQCVPYVQKMCEALQAVPLDLPDSPQPVFDFSVQDAKQEEEFGDYEQVNEYLRI